jgi:hypothetical protein
MQNLFAVHTIDLVPSIIDTNSNSKLFTIASSGLIAHYAIIS